MTFSFIVSDLYFRNISFESFEVIFPFNYNFAECFEEVRIIFFPSEVDTIWLYII